LKGLSPFRADILKKLQSGILQARHGIFLPCLAFLLILTSEWMLLHSWTRAGENIYVEELLARAEEQRLHEQRDWHILLHYQTGLFRGVHSLIDDPGFFLAADGKHNPEAELTATIRSFFKESPAEGELHPLCRFVARFSWLQQELAIDEAQLPAVSCTEFKEAFAKVQPQAAVLIFPGSHLNSPASMFGHTLINIEGPYTSKLLSYAVNYSAQTSETNGLTYALKGIFGRYRGYFSILPYYAKVREYNDLDRRDIWEYELNFDPAEVARMFLHIWELRDVYSDYFFFDENCSYNLLFLLEAARPSLNLTGQSRPWVIPIDTVRIIEKAGLIATSTYRPSKATRIEHIASRMTPRELGLAKELLAGELAPREILSAEVTTDGRIGILDLAIEDLEYRYYLKELAQAEYREKYLALLAARSKLGRPVQETEIPVPLRPDHGHGSNRLGIAVGVWKGDLFQEIRIRPAYHHLQDADEGYRPGSQIEFADLVLRVYPDRSKMELHALDFIDILSLSPRNRFLQPISWKVATGFQQAVFPDGDDHLIYRLNPGGGFAWGSGQRLFYLLFESELRIGGRYRDNFAIGAGASAGMVANITDRWKAAVGLRGITYEFGDDFIESEMHLNQNIVIDSRQSIFFNVAIRREFGNENAEAMAGWNFYW
jgi:hypothetical protein